MIIVLIITVALLVCAATYFFLYKKNLNYKYAYSTRIDKEFYDNGGIRRTATIKIKTRLSDEIVVNEVLDGVEQFFYPSGVLNRQNNWKDGKREGDFTVYYEDGGVYITGSYKNNKLNSQYKAYNKKKELIFSKKY